MEQEASVDNVKGCERLGWLCPCQTGGTGMKPWDYSLDISQRRQIEKGGENLGKQFMFVTCFFFFFPRRGFISLSASCSFSSIFAIVFQLGSKTR